MERFEKLKSLRAAVNWKIVKERHDLLNQLYDLTSDWRVRLPNLRDVFQPEEIDWLLSEAAKELNNYNQGRFIEFVARTGYQDEPKFGENGKLQRLHRTTAVHHAAKFSNNYVLLDLFEIYNKFHVNYVDESGLTHFHVACEFGFVGAVKKFLDLGEDPNYRWPQSGDTPLHLAVELNNKILIELMLRNHADPNLANYDGSTPFHIIASTENNNEDLAMFFFKICDDLQLMVQVNAEDKCRNTPLHEALASDNMEVAKVLLRRGANPNSVNEEGQIPLHIICKRTSSKEELLAMFPRLAQLDVMDTSGRTPLQWAVENLVPRVVDILLDHGADLSSFAFPTTSDLDKRLDTRVFSNIYANFKLRMASGLLFIAENLEKRGYVFNRSEALTIMKFFAKHDLFKKPSNLDEFWYKNEEFVSLAQTFKTRSSLSLYQWIRLTPEEEGKILTYEDYFKLSEFDDVSILPEGVRDACQMHLCEMMSRGFFQRWALDPFWKLIHCRLPLECSEMVLSNLMNEDLYHIFLAAEGQSL